MRAPRREILTLVLLAAAPIVAYAPALLEGRLLAPGEGAALHLPLRVEAWRAWQRGELPSWNPSIFCGTPLLASYRPGALHPLMLALALLPPFHAFQVLVLLSLALCGPLAYAYARRLGAEPTGALVTGLSFALGPYLVAQLGDTATLVAAPALLLVLLAGESHLERPRAAAFAALAGAVALLLFAGSPQAVVAGGLLLSTRLALVALAPGCRPGAAGLRPARGVAGSLAATLVGVLLAGPQLLPTLIALREAGPGGAGAGGAHASVLAGMAGFVVRSVSHTPTAIFGLAAVPLVAAQPGLRAVAGLGVAALLALVAGGLVDPAGGVALAVDLALAVLAGLSLSAQWAAKNERRGRRLRRLALIAALFAAAALSVATTVTGPLDADLASPVGLLALGLILYFALAQARDPVAQRVFLLPLVASFLLQPWGRHAWAGAPRAAELEQGTPTRQAIDRAMGPRQGERTLVLAEAWPRRSAADLGWANLATFAGRRNANGYDPLVPARRLAVFDGMRVDGTLPRSLLETDPGRLELLGVRWLQVPTSDLVTAADADGLGDALDVVIEPRRPHLFALPITFASEVRLVGFLAGAKDVAQGTVVAECVVRLATGREIWLPIRAGLETAEWAWERPDVRSGVRHQKAPVHASYEAREGFLAHEYRATLTLPGRFAVTGLRLRSWPDAPPFWLLRAGLRDATTGRGVGVGVAAAHASDVVRLAEAVDTPLVSLFEVRRGIGPAWVVESLRLLPDDGRVLDLLRSPTRTGVDARREALASLPDAAAITLPPGSRSSPADVARAVGGRIVVRAAGPGLLVVGEGYDPGWRASVDGRAARVVRVNGDRLGIVIGDGPHRVVLRHAPRGLLPGVGTALLGLGVLLALAARARAARRLTPREAAC